MKIFPLNNNSAANEFPTHEEYLNNTTTVVSSNISNAGLNYNIQPCGNKNTFIAFNATQEMYFNFYEKGFRSLTKDWFTELSLTNVLIDNKSLQTGRLKPYANSNELNYKGNNFEIQYLNTEEGVRQNFYVLKAPNNAKQLIINLSLNTSLPNAFIHNNELIISSDKQNIFGYKDLHAWDNNHSVLQSKMELNNDMLALVINIENAVFPVTIDPLSVSYNWKQEGDQKECQYGFSIDGGGDINGDGYDDIIVGAPLYTNTFESEGAAFIYFGSSSGLNHTADWIQYGGQSNAQFGKCVSIAGDVNGDGFNDILIGAHQFNTTENLEGKAFLYYGGSSGPSLNPAWSVVGEKKSAKLGESLSIVGDVNADGYDDVCIGAHGWDNDEDLGSAGGRAGKASVYLGSATGLNTIPQMTVKGSQTDANIGISIDRAGDVNGDGYMDVAIGGYIFLIGDGMICVFKGGPDGVDLETGFMAIGGAMDTSFYAVNLSTAGDLNGDGYDDVVIGAPRFDANGIYQSGKLHVHYGGSEGLDSVIGWIATGTQYDEKFAFNVNNAGDINQDGYDDLLVSSRFFDNGSDTDAGKAELYLGGPAWPQSTPVWTFTGEKRYDCLGINLCRAGDLNGDGFEDIIVSSDVYSENLRDQGVVYAFYGEAQSCDPPSKPFVKSLTSTSVLISWRWLYGATLYKVYLLDVSSGIVKTFNCTDSIKNISGLESGRQYKLSVAAKCEAGWTDFSKMITFITPSLRLASEIITDDVFIYPIPADEELFISLPKADHVTIRIYNLSGEELYQKQFDLIVGEVISINAIAEFENGIYLLSIENYEKKILKKFIKI
ncbi:MAG: T9SS type A sorting domain-containing protein [Chitinophagales bacterium]